MQRILTVSYWLCLSIACVHILIAALEVVIQPTPIGFAKAAFFGVFSIVWARAAQRIRGRAKGK